MFKVRLFEIKLRQKVVCDPQTIHKISKKLAYNCLPNAHVRVRLGVTYF